MDPFGSSTSQAQDGDKQISLSVFVKRTLLELFYERILQRLALEVQNAETCCAIFNDFWIKISDSDWAKIAFPDKWFEEYAALNRKIHWFPHYGAAVLFRKLDSIEVFVTVVGLDGWNSAIHSSVVKGREQISEPDVFAPAVFELGPFPKDKTLTLIQELNSRLLESEQNHRGDRRGQGGGNEGNQKTPSFLREKLRQAIVQVGETDIGVGGGAGTRGSFQGGTTDVGLHTGCLKRNTSAPLVFSVVQTVLRMSGEPDDDHFRTLLAIYLTSFLDVLPKITTYDARKMDRYMVVIRDAESHVSLMKNTLLRGEMLDHMKVFHDMLLAVPYSKEFLELKNESISNVIRDLKDPKIPSVPSFSKEPSLASKLENARREAKANLRWSDIEADAFNGKLQDAWVQLHALNVYFWNLAGRLNRDRQEIAVIDFVGKLNRLSEVVKLATKAADETVLVMSKAICSYECLATWICFCWAQKTAEQQFAWFSRYKPALDPNDLQVLVLEHKEAFEAAIHVRAFLEARGDRSSCPFRNTGDTLQLALEYGWSSGEFQGIHQDFLREAERRVEERWKIVQEKQAELRKLDPQLRTANAELQVAANERTQAQQIHFSYNKYGHKVYEQGYYTAVEKENRAQTKVDNLKSKVKHQEAKPANLSFGLPRSLDTALRWLFFFYMDPRFKHVASLAHRGQSMLWSQVPAEKHVRQSLHDWFQCHGTFPGLDLGAMVLGSQSSNYQPIQTPDIRSWTRETGIFFPDSFSQDPIWTQSNPFERVDTKALTMLYTERLPNSKERLDSTFLQQLIAMLPSPKRDNDGVARREKRPEWLTHEQFLAFSSQRATPRTQLRHLLHAFYEDLFPFQNYCVHVLLKQTVFQFGEADWFKDMSDGPSNGLELLHECLSSEAKELSDSPKNCMRLQLDGILLAYFGQYHAACAEASRSVSNTFKRWAETISNDPQDEQAVNRYAKQALFYASALFCLSYFELLPEDIESVARLIVLFRNCSLLSQGTVDRSLEEAVMRVMATRVDRVSAYMRRHPSFLSKILKLVDETAPSTGSWLEVDIRGASCTACFEMVDVNTHLYSINMLNGFVLFDGSPKNFLPSAVVENELFARTFGQMQNFEAIQVGFQHYRTARVLKGKVYAFKMDPSQRLYIFEYMCGRDTEVLDESCRLQLLPRNTLKIPHHLQEAYSHWYSPSEDAVLLRPPRASRTEVHYIMTQHGTFLVPDKDRNMSLGALLKKTKGYERLYVGTTSFGEVLHGAGFEKTSFILTFADHSGSVIRHSLPRYGLNFLQDDKEVRSYDHEGFSVSRWQGLLDTLPKLKCFLSLTRPGGSERLLIPHVAVQQDARMSVSDSWEDELHYHTYNRNPRFKYLVSDDTLGRLHLASIYASSCCLVPDRLMSMPGADVATDLLRQCAQNEAFREDEKKKLIEVAEHSSLSCSLRITVWWLWRSSVALVQPYRRPLERHPNLGYDGLAADEYRSSKHAKHLEKEEEAVIFGTTSRKASRAVQHATDLVASRTAPHIRYVKDSEEDLFMKGIQVSKTKKKSSFPLSIVGENGGIPKKVVEDLRDSFQTFSKLPRYSSAPVDVGPMLERVKRKRCDLERQLLTSLNKTSDPAQVGAVLTGRIQRATTVDLMRVAFDPLHILEYQPEAKDSQGIQGDCIAWCLLCVLEDKLCRLEKAVVAMKEDMILQEIRCIRNWDPTKHPRWLAFEVEQMLQIRPKQYTTVDQLLANPGSAIQLNMGEGKTRVLVPMLIMELCRNQGRRARINLLPAIFHEALHFYRQSLVASMQNIKLFTIPFQRSFVLDENSSKIITEEMARCWALGGCIVATPQHRNSLLLKQHDAGIIIPGLDDDIVDILDESDAILDYNFQLVYAIGDQVPLPSCMNRYSAIEAVLEIVSHLVNDLSAKLGRDHFLTHFEKVQHGEFSKPRILEASPFAESAVAVAVATNLLDRPPHHFRWMKSIPDEPTRSLLLTLLVDPGFEDVRKVFSEKPLLYKNKEDILALRGCLAFGLVFHALKNRYRVSYGLKSLSSQEDAGDPAKGTTKLAVPYAASDTPKARAEFSHPDMAIIYTCLSYLHEGLALRQFIEAMQILETKSEGLQKRLFEEWIESIREGVPRDELERFDRIRKVDMTNAAQVELMHARLGRCMHVVFFWLNEVIFPNETHQFPQRRITSPWNLTASGQAIGFSGTDDNRFLLPLSVQQIYHENDELRAINGQMLRVILESTKKVHLIGSNTQGASLGERVKSLLQKSNADSKPPLWQFLLGDSLRLGATALIDAGGLMAGAGAADIVEFLSCCIEKLPARVVPFRGIVYFSVIPNKWTVYQLETKRHVALSRSPVKEDKCFVYFDESRCRGSDMKLLPSAGAVVTLDKRMTKDKFLQGCARMRKLGPNGQWLIIAGTEETLSSKSTVNSVLEGIIQASIRAAQRGLMTFYERGRNFDSFPLPVDDALELDSPYAGHITDYDDFCHFLDSHHERDRSSEGVSKVAEYCRSIGQGVEAHISAIGQECEKEVEAEAEEQQEQEMQIELREPYEQVDWDYAKVFSTSSKQLFGATFVPLSSLVKEKLKPLAKIKWSDKVYCSPNFFKTTSCYSRSTNMSLYLRPVCHLIIFRDNKVVLVSAYEMDKLLPLWWREGGRPRAVLDNLFLLTKGGRPLDNRTLPVSAEVMATLKLFRGGVEYTPEEQVVLKNMFQDLKRPHDTVQELLFMRSRLGHFERSHLDEVAYHALHDA